VEATAGNAFAETWLWPGFERGPGLEAEFDSAFVDKTGVVGGVFVDETGLAVDDTRGCVDTMGFKVSTGSGLAWSAASTTVGEFFR